MQFRVNGMEDDGEGRNINVEVKFNAVLAEARQQGVALAGLISKLAPAESKPATKAPGKLPDNVSPLDRLRGKLEA